MRLREYVVTEWQAEEMIVEINEKFPMAGAVVIQKGCPLNDGLGCIEFCAEEDTVIEISEFIQGLNFAAISTKYD